MRELIDFLVEVETGRNPIVLQLTDPQIIDAGQARYEDRLSEEEKEFWATDKVEERCYRYIRETIHATKPDLILLTGDFVYGEFDDSGKRFLDFVAFMESFQIPWAPILGNHDTECELGVDWQCAQFHAAKHCLFKQRTLTGNGNYTVGIWQGNELKRVFFMLDSNGSYCMSEASFANGHTTKEKGFGADQIAWFQEKCAKIKAVTPNTKLSFAYHIQQYMFKDAFAKYGFTNEGTKENLINIDMLKVKEDGDFGYLGNNMTTAWDKDYSVWNQMKDMGIDSIFVGHEHCNSASVVHQGIRFQYGQKSSEYDRFNSLMKNGTIVQKVLGQGTPLVGGTVFAISEEDGAIQTPYIYLCKEGKI